MATTPNTSDKTVGQTLESLTRGRFIVLVTGGYIRIVHQPTGDAHVYRHDGTADGILRALRRADAGEHGDDEGTEIQQGTRI